MDDRWENKIYENIHYSRFIVSYAKKGGKLNRKFKEWLKHLVINGKHIPQDIIDDIYFLGTNGKFELENDAMKYLTNA